VGLFDDVDQAVLHEYTLNGNHAEYCVSSCHLGMTH